MGVILPRIDLTWSSREESGQEKAFNAAIRPMRNLSSEQRDIENEWEYDDLRIDHMCAVHFCNTDRFV